MDDVRETFVLGVRLALDRARELMVQGALPEGRPEVESGRELLDAVRSIVSAQPARRRPRRSSGAGV